MRRDPAALAATRHDLLVVGGGIFGIFAAWDAALRGLSVAIIEKGDWAEAASANCFKIVHGGIRYLQHGDVARIRQSSRERNVLLRIAPHQVRPLPILIPTYGHGRSGREILEIGLRLYEAATWDRNRGIADPARRIPPARWLPRDEVLALYPDLPATGLTGGAVFHDGQMASPARLALSVLRGAVERGAQAANYVAATRLARRGDRVTGVDAVDLESGEPLRLEARFVLNAAGAWSEPLLDAVPELRPRDRSTFSRDAFFIVPRRLGPDVALAVKGRTRDPDAILSREARHLFLVPWRDCTLVGVWHVVYTGAPDEVTLTDRDVREFIDEANWAYPGLDARLEEVSSAPHGLVLFGRNTPGARNLRYGKRSRVIDHKGEHGLDGLITLIGIRYTTARSDAEQVVERIVARLGRPARAGVTDRTPVHGGAFESTGRLLEDARAEWSGAVPEDLLASLVRSHGAAHRELLEHVRRDPRQARPIARTAVIAAEVVHAARAEMARRLADVVFRRTDLGTGSDPGAEALQEAAALLGAELGWDEARRERELQATRSAFRGQPETRTPSWS